MTAATKSGLTAIFVAALVMAVACYLGWKSGCVFDSKQGFGDAKLGIFLSNWAFACALLACGLLVFSVLLFARRTLPLLVVVASVLLVALIAVPSSILLLLVAESYGVAACKQTVPSSR